MQHLPNFLSDMICIILGGSFGSMYSSSIRVEPDSLCSKYLLSLCCAIPQYCVIEIVSALCMVHSPYHASLSHTKNDSLPVLIVRSHLLFTCQIATLPHFRSNHSVGSQK